MVKKGTLDEYVAVCQQLINRIDNQETKQSVTDMIRQRTSEAQKAIEEVSNTQLRPESEEREIAVIEDNTKKLIYDETISYLLPEKQSIVKGFLGTLTPDKIQVFRELYYPKAPLALGDFLDSNTFSYDLFLPVKAVDLGQFSLYCEATGQDMASMASIGQSREGERPPVKVTWERGSSLCELAE